ncbi:di-heme oxidoredictase family protein [Thalassobaculum sp.]|uniref:di-heme oxidoredictase family protein n=1 Tax=Thalassobaculum sp. TaxID=2022740 RepID=UPI0032ED22F5
MRIAVATLALLLPLAALPVAADPLDVAVGKALFDRMWVPSPASTRGSDGLGPLYTARSCAGCHAGGGGSRTAARPDGTIDPKALVVRLGSDAGPGDPVYGLQVQTLGTAVVAPEAAVAFDLVPSPDPALGPLVTGIRLDALAYGALPPATRTEARRAPALHGIGLLAGVPDDALNALADPADRDGDGISGRLGSGRFGWKALEPTVESQTTAALLTDLGLSTVDRPDHAGDCTAAEAACLRAPHGDGGHADGVEVPADALRTLVAYVSALPAPVAAPDPRGEALFRSAGCAACHVPELAGAGGQPVRAFTDLLLHDMGPGLEGGFPEGEASRAEWRTAALWGLGRAVRHGDRLLHDGRAATIDEAIRWHGGEAARARDRYRDLPPAEAARLLAYLEGL